MYSEIPSPLYNETRNVIIYWKQKSGSRLTEIHLSERKSVNLEKWVFLVYFTSMVKVVSTM